MNDGWTFNLNQRMHFVSVFEVFVSSIYRKGINWVEDFSKMTFLYFSRLLKHCFRCPNLSFNIPKLCVCLIMMWASIFGQITTGETTAKSLQQWLICDSKTRTRIEGKLTKKIDIESCCVNIRVRKVEIILSTMCFLSGCWCLCCCSSSL